MLTLLAAVALTLPAPRVMPERAEAGVCLSDADGFAVDHVTAREYWRMAKRHIEHHEKYLLRTYPFARVQPWMAEAERCRAAWDTLDNLTWPGTDKSPEYRIAQLKRLRDILGEADYQARRMPPPCPGHLFED